MATHLLLKIVHFQDLHVAASPSSGGGGLSHPLSQRIPGHLQHQAASLCSLLAVVLANLGEPAHFWAVQGLKVKKKFKTEQLNLKKKLYLLQRRKR